MAEATAAPAPDIDTTSFLEIATNTPPRSLVGAADRRQSELEDCAVRHIRRRPQSAAMCVDDRTTDRQPHPHTFRLGGEKGLEKPIRLRQVEPRARIPDRDEHLAGFVVCSFDFEPPLPGRRTRHRLDA